MPGAEEKYSFFDKPDWRGDYDISDKRLFIPTEHRLGDLIQFCRYAPLLIFRADQVIGVNRLLIKTLHPSITLVVKGDRLPEFDVYCPVMSLPYAFKPLEWSDYRWLQSRIELARIWALSARIGLVWLL